MPESRKRKNRSAPSWGETVFALLVAVLLGSVMFGAVWTRIEEFETGKWDALGITQAIVLGLLLIGLVFGLWKYLARRVQD